MAGSRRLERFLIGLVTGLAALYALFALWPSGTPTGAPQVAGPVPEASEPSEEAPAAARRLEAQVIASLVRIGSAQLSFRGLHKRFGSMEELARENLLSPKYAGGAIIDGYQYAMGVAGERFALHADPIPGPGRHYFVDESLDIRYDDNGRASSSSPYLEYGKNPAPAPKEPETGPPALR